MPLFMTELPNFFPRPDRQISFLRTRTLTHSCPLYGGANPVYYKKAWIGPGPAHPYLETGPEGLVAVGESNIHLREWRNWQTRKT